MKAAFRVLVLLSVSLASVSLLQGCIIPRTAAKTAGAVTRGAVKTVGKVTKTVTKPVRR